MTHRGLLTIALVVMAIVGRGVGRAGVLYQQDFGTTNGGTTLAAVGWKQVLTTGGYSGCYSEPTAFDAQTALPLPSGTAYFGGPPGMGIFYTTNGAGAGTGGDSAFTSVDPTLYTNLTFSVQSQWSYQGANLQCWFAAQVGGTWWVATNNPITTAQASAGPIFYKTSFQYTTASNSWNYLTNTSLVGIGTRPGTNLSGNITGVGIVVRVTGAEGSWDFNNLLIEDGISQSTNGGLGSITVVSNSEAALTLAWLGNAQVVLQSSTNLGPLELWQNVAGTAGQSSAVVPKVARQMFFRLANAGPAGVSLAQANLSFETNGGQFSLPLGWFSSGNTNADSVTSLDAYAGSFSLQHSNNAAYQVQTSVLITNLPNGFYRLGARGKSSGGQKVCYLAGNGRITSVPPLTNWTEMVIRGVSVTNGQCLIQVYSDANSGNWCRLDALTLTNDNIAYTFLKGGDISELPRMEYYGGQFYDNGVAKDCLTILKDHGFNIVRLRMYNDPGNTNYFPANQLDPLGWQNPAHTLALAQRARALGFQIELTFHYSDYWEGGDNQYKPHDWVGLSFVDLKTALSNFTANFMLQMVNQGTPPEYVSLGNEMQGGILYPDGSVTNWPQLAQLLNAGHDAVKSVSPSSKVVLHMNNVSAGVVNFFCNQAVAQGVRWDVIGCSYYPFWTGYTSEQARAQINSWYANFNKPVLIMETGYNWATNTCNGFPGQLTNNGPETFPSTILGQKNFLLKCFNDLKLVNDGHCIGDMYWDPVFICVPGQGWQNGQRNVVGNTTLFDFTGHNLPSLDAFLYNN